MPQTQSPNGGQLADPAESTTAGEKWRLIRFWLIVGSLLGLAVVAVVVITVAYSFGERLSTIRVTYTGAGDEVRDAKIPLRDKAERLPDYRLELICQTKGFWIFNQMKYGCGPIPNRSAAEPIDFTFAGDVARDKVQQINLFEDDPIDDDLVASVQVSQAMEEADGYLFELETERSLRFGFERIWRGNFGFAVLAMLLALVFALLTGALEFLFSLVVAVLSIPFRR